MINNIKLTLLIVLLPFLGVTQELPGLFSSEIDSLNKYGKEIIESRDRRRAGLSVPAKGLFLTEITY